MEVLYEDECLIALVKPPGADSENRFREQAEEYCGGLTLYAVHRLDRDTGGIIIYAKAQRSAAALSSQFSARKTVKRYCAICSGAPSEPAGTMTDLLFYDRNRNKSYVVDRVRKGVKEAELEYSLTRTVSDGGNMLSLCDILLHTGRTHQIRVQFGSRGLPLAGDRKYGSGIKCGLALFAFSISFTHPETGKTVELSAGPPTDTYPWNLFETIKKGRSE